MLGENNMNETTGVGDAEVALIVGGGPGISASCARLFAGEGMKVAVAARNIEKDVLKELEQHHGVMLITCDAADADSVASMFERVTNELGAPRLVVHNIDGRVREVFRKPITEVEPNHVLATIKNSTFSAFLVGQQAAKSMLANHGRDGHRGTILLLQPRKVRRVSLRVWPESSCPKAFMWLKYRLMLRSVGCNRMVIERIGWRVRQLKITWRIRIILPSFICSSTVSTSRPGLLRWYLDLGRKTGNA